MSKVIEQFRNEYFFMSNFYTAPVEVDGMTFRTSEHAFQAYKATNLEDAIRIRDCATATVAKQVGRRIKIRSDWEQIKLQVMRLVVYRKFMQNSGLQRLLLDTGEAVLVEGNNYEGENHLGRILMDIRHELKRIKNA